MLRLTRKMKCGRPRFTRRHLVGKKRHQWFKTERLKQPSDVPQSIAERIKERLRKKDERKVPQFEVRVGGNEETPRLETFLIGKARSLEIKFESLPSSEQPNMLATIAKEWATWQQFGATKPLSQPEFSRLSKGEQR